MERVMGIEPTSSAWEAEVLPLNYTRSVQEKGRLAPLSEASTTFQHCPNTMTPSFDSSICNKQFFFDKNAVNAT